MATESIAAVHDSHLAKPFWSPETLSGAGVWGRRESPLNCSRLNEARIQPRFFGKQKRLKPCGLNLLGLADFRTFRTYLTSTLLPSAKVLCSNERFRPDPPLPGCGDGACHPLCDEKNP